MKKRVFLIVLDSCGAGEMPDCANFGDKDCHTIKRISTSDKFSCENTWKMGIGNIDGLDFLGTNENPIGRVARLTEKSMGKDTTIGHWEIAGLVLDEPFRVYPNGFPQDIIEKFIKKEPYLDSFCKFMAIKDKNDGKEWIQWKSEEYDEDRLFMWKFIQYEFFTQWKAVKEYANGKGIKIIGDIPIYVSFDSCDVWSNKKQYLLDKKGKPSKVAGVPPDYFSEDGQLWGNPLYNWDEMEKDGYKWWCDRIRHTCRLFDGIRIDHFRGIESFWAVPAKAKTAKEGKWVKGPGMKLVEKLKKAAGKAFIIAEDLGDITPKVEALVKESGFPGMRVFQFGFLSDADSPHRPHNYPANCISYTGTHDNNTLLGYLWELDDETRRKMLEYCGHSGEWQTGCESIIRTMFASHSDTVILPIQDLLGFGSDTRLNVPGTPTGNWSYRVTEQQFNSIDNERFYKLNAMYSRLNHLK